MKFIKRSFGDWVGPRVHACVNIGAGPKSKRIFF